MGVGRERPVEHLELGDGRTQPSEVVDDLLAIGRGQALG